VTGEPLSRRPDSILSSQDALDRRLVVVEVFRAPLRVVASVGDFTISLEDLVAVTLTFWQDPVVATRGSLRTRDTPLSTSVISAQKRKCEPRSS
jgi:hypothetical protein